MAEKKKKKPRSGSKLAAVVATADDAGDAELAETKDAVEGGEPAKAKKKGGAKRKSKQAIPASKLSLSMEAVPKVDPDEMEKMNRDLGLFSPRGEEAPQEDADAPSALFSPRPRAGSTLDPKEKLTNKEKRNSIRKEIRRSIRLSRGMPAVNPEEIDLSEPIEKVIGEEPKQEEASSGCLLM